MTFAVSEICRTLEQADTISVNASNPVHRAFNNRFLVMVYLPHALLASVFGHLMLAGGLVDLALKLVANSLGGIVGALLSGLLDVPPVHAAFDVRAA